MKVTFYSTHSYDRESFSKMNAAYGMDLEFLARPFNAQTIKWAKGSDAVCLFVNDNADRAALQALSAAGIKFIAMRCAGFNNVDLAAAAEFGIKVTHVPAYSPHGVAEYALGLMLTLNRKINRAYFRTRDGNFSLHGFLGFDMCGKTAGIIGTGRIARVLIKILLAMGMKVIAYDLFPDQKLARQEGFTYVDLNEIFAKSDVISLHCPLTPQTHYLINEDAINKMKHGVMIINTGRGKLINTEALIYGIKSGIVSAAGLDVYEEEEKYFYEDDSDRIISDDTLARLLSFNNVIVTSHQGFFTHEALANIAASTLDSLKAYAEHQPLVNEIKVEN